MKKRIFSVLAIMCSMMFMMNGCGGANETDLNDDGINAVDNDGVNLLSESNRQTTPVSCLRFDNCLYYIRFFLFLQSPYMIF